MIIELFNLLKAKLGEKEAEGLVQYVKSSAAEELKRNVDTLATREFVKDEINNVRLEIKEFKSEILRWMFIYWTGTALALLGGMLGFIKFFYEITLLLAIIEPSQITLKKILGLHSTKEGLIQL